MNLVRISSAIALLLLVSSSLDARVISYGALTSRETGTATQRRTNRHVLILEKVRDCPDIASRAFLYDSQGIEEPRDVSPGGAPAAMSDAALWEGPDGSLRILISTNFELSPGENPGKTFRLVYSADGGVHWTALSLPGVRDARFYVMISRDVGGPIARNRSSSVRIGSAATPFFYITPERSDASLWAIRANGSTERLASLYADVWPHFMGTDIDGTRVLVAADSVIPSSGVPDPALATPGISVIDSSGRATKLLDVSPSFVGEGFLTPAGGAYFEGRTDNPQSPFSDRTAIAFLRNGVLTELAASSSTVAADLFAVPNADFSGAWLIRRDSDATVLSFHSPAAGLVAAWRDASKPQIEAVHVGASGKLLLQAYRSRPSINPIAFPHFADPALAIWKVGQPAPASYDELFLNEQDDKGFVHLDVDSIEAGAPFFFDAGSENYNFCSPAGGGPSGGSGGGGDVLQEWGVVRGSLHQNLVIPATARAAGAYGAAWRSELVLRNPDPDPLRVNVHLLSNPDMAPPVPDAEVLLPGSSVVRIPDVLSSLFGLSSGAGGLLLSPEGTRSIEATSRTYTESASGSYGMSVPAVDAWTALGANVPASFSAGLLGAGFRTNFVATDVSGRGSTATIRFSPRAGASGASSIVSAPALGQRQLSDLASSFGGSGADTGAISFSPTDGASVAGLIAIDNATNDPTWFPPDGSTSVARTIPALVHASGLNGAQFRTDLFLFNPASTTQGVRFAAKAWETEGPEQTLTLSLGPRESRILTDALATLFGRSGVARLRIQSTATTWAPEGGVRITSRTYTVTPSGATYGMLIPALNAFQSVGAGEALEILLPAGGHRFRTNLALVELSAAPGSGGSVSVAVEVYGAAGALLDRFEATVPVAGGVQIDDLFRARGLGDGPVTGWLRISPAGGLLAAYASVIDNGTNDALYAAAALAAK
ncbi:MAG: hypothetical protein ABI584_02545 [Acidobacteriota bacterium]